MNQNEVDTNCEMFCQTMKCYCNTVGLICFAFGFIVISFLTSLEPGLHEPQLPVEVRVNQA